MKMPRSGLFILGLALAIAGCATIISGTSQEIQITSSPSAARVIIEHSVDTAMETAWEGSTPATATLKRKYSYFLTVSLDGYEPVEMGLESGTNGWVWGNLLFGGFVGLIIDFSNGAAKALKPNEIHVELVAASTMSLGERKSTLYAVFQIKNVDGSLTVSSVPLIPDPNYAVEAQE